MASMIGVRQQFRRGKHRRFMLLHPFVSGGFGTFMRSNHHRRVFAQNPLFRWSTDGGRGRCCMLISVSLSRVISDIISGSLYTAFLTANHFSMVDMGFLASLQLFAACFSIFSPMILERIRRRKWVLAAGRLVYYLLNLVGLSVIPLLTSDSRTRLALFAALLLLSNIINELFQSGYSVWHLNFIPEEVRAQYYSYQQILSVFTASVALFGFSRVADLLRGTPHEAQALFAIRMAGMVLALIDVLVLTLPKEYPYLQRKMKVRLSNLIRLPLRSKKFMLTMLVVAWWSFAASLPVSAWSYHLLNTVGASVTMINFNNILYMLALVLLMRPWQKLLERKSWFITFAVAALCHVPSVLACAFVTAGNYRWLYFLIMLAQGIDGVALNLTWIDFQYINTPIPNQTYYIAFYTLLTNLMSFLGRATGTLFVKLFGGGALTLFGTSLGAAQLLMVMQAALFLGCALFIFLRICALQPGPITERLYPQESR